MSAKVYNPMILSEISTLRSPAIGRRPVSATSAARITAARVKRDLFGPVDKEDSKKFIERELAAQNDVLSKKWGFDFRSGEPLQNHEQFQWERVPPTSAPSCFVGGMVALTRAAHVVGTAATASEDLMDQRAERENGSCFSTTTTSATTASSGASSPVGSDAEMDAPVMTHPLAKISLSSSSSSSSFPASATRARRQQRITDYLKERKRLSTSAPKVALAKRARHMLSGSPAASSSSSSSSQSSQ